MSSSDARSSGGRSGTRSRSMVTLPSSDGQTMVVEKSAAMVSIMLKNIVQNNYDSSVINVRVEGRILMRVVEYCKAHVVGSNVSELNEFDDDFINVEPGVIFDLVTGLCEYRPKYQALQNLTQRRVSELMRENLLRRFSRYWMPLKVTITTSVARIARVTKGIRVVKSLTYLV
ncbi:hypothetical protein OROMI_019171 [Orobanche minor]